MHKRESVILVAEDERSALVGFCQLYPSFCSVEAKPIYVLYDLFVIPSARQSGAGSLSHEPRFYGAVSTSSRLSQCRACSRWGPHMSVLGWRPAQTAGRLGWVKRRQPRWGSSWMQGTPAGLPWGMPGMGLLMDGAMQQAPQPRRQVGAALKTATG
jgi:hypothetical protein